MVLRSAMAVVALVAAVAATDCTAGEYDSFRNYLSSCKMGDMTCMQGKFNSLDALDATGTCRNCITSAFSGGDFAGVSNCFPATAASAPSQQQGNPCSDKDLESVYPIISAECQYDFVCAKDKMAASPASASCKSCFAGITDNKNMNAIVACVGVPPEGMPDMSGAPAGMAGMVPQQKTVAGECTAGDLAAVFPDIKETCDYDMECAQRKVAASSASAKCKGCFAGITTAGGLGAILQCIGSAPEGGGIPGIGGATMFNNPEEAMEAVCGFLPLVSKCSEPLLTLVAGDEAAESNSCQQFHDALGLDKMLLALDFGSEMKGIPNMPGGLAGLTQICADGNFEMPPGMINSGRRLLDKHNGMAAIAGECNNADLGVIMQTLPTCGKDMECVLRELAKAKVSDHCRECFDAVKETPSKLMKCVGGPPEGMVPTGQLPARATANSDTVFAELDTSKFGEMCEKTSSNCMPRFFAALTEMNQCFEDITFTMDGDAENMMAVPTKAFQGMINRMRNLMQKMCTKNDQDVFCTVEMLKTETWAMHQADALTEETNIFTDDTCSALAGLGCCTGTLHDIILLKDPSQAKVFEGMLSQQCALGAVPVSCAGPGVTKQVNKLAFTVTGVSSGKFTALGDLERAEVRLSLQRDVAKSLGMLPADVEIGALSPSNAGLRVSAVVESTAGLSAAEVDVKLFSNLDLSTTRTRLSALGVATTATAIAVVSETHQMATIEGGGPDISDATINKLIDDANTNAPPATNTIVSKTYSSAENAAAVRGPAAALALLTGLVALSLC